LAAGVSIAVKPSGGLLLGVVAAFIVLARKIVLKPVNFASLTMGAVMALAPLAIFNLGAFGGLAILRPPAYPLIAEASEIRALTGDHNLGFYDPERPRSRPAGAKQNVKIALDRLSSWIREGVLGGHLIPSFMWFFVPCFFLERYFKHGNIWPMPSAERVFAGIVVLLSLGGVVLACVVHYEERYWNFLFPLLAIVTIVAMTGMRRYFLPLLLVYTFSSAALYYHDRKIEVASPAYALLAQLVPRDSVILTPNPWETTFHTRIKSVATPYTDN
jgi:ribosomal protein S16